MIRWENEFVELELETSRNHPCLDEAGVATRHKSAQTTHLEAEEAEPKIGTNNAELGI